MDLFNWVVRLVCVLLVWVYLNSNYVLIVSSVMMIMVVIVSRCCLELFGFGVGLGVGVGVGVVEFIKLNSLN